MSGETTDRRIQVGAATPFVPTHQAGMVGGVAGIGSGLSMNVPRRVWLLICDYGSDGLHEPVTAFDSLDKAKAAQEMLSAYNATTTRLIEALIR